MGDIPLFNPWAPPIFAQQPADNIYTIKPGPDYDKWDEALQAHGRILLPKALDEPQTWLNAPHFQRFLQDYHREDMPDGSVVLSKIVPMS